MDQMMCGWIHGIFRFEELFDTTDVVMNVG